HLCAYGLYAPINEMYLRGLGVQTILGGEFEQGLVNLYNCLVGGRPIELPTISLARQQFLPPDRSGLPHLEVYAHLTGTDGGQKVVGYTEASRGCKHTCRHCPIVPVYNGRFRIIQPDIVLADIRQQVAAGAQHITFGDPDFLNGPAHALRIVEALHSEFPDVTYDATIKVEHLLKHARLLPYLRDTGCLFVTSAVESVDDAILQIFDKGHTRADFVRVVNLLHEVGLALNPTFVAFSPWMTSYGYADLLAMIAELRLIDHVTPIQYAIRLLIPAESKLLALAEVRALVRPFDDAALVYPWNHPQPQVDWLYESIFKLVKASQTGGESRRILFARIWQMLAGILGEQMPKRPADVSVLAVPMLSEDWY
ncbi:MAG: radical SAM protein, partial [Chloroflexi bacterium]|nr:radical SAM protein [Chloroflexota bacterium]